jgi:hypothetical protein
VDVKLVLCGKGRTKAWGAGKWDAEDIVFEREGVTYGERRRLHNEGLHNFYSSASIIRVIKSRRMGWAGHVARMGSREMCTEFGGKT